MANDENQDSWVPQESKETSFISQQEWPKVDTMYSDFFQETSDGKISVWSKAKKSWLEMITTILWYIVPVVILIVVLGSLHVFLRTQETSSFAENYQFLCPYMNGGVNLDTPERWCNTISTIQSQYTEKQKSLAEDILKKLNEYIPIKISRNLIATSPERNFIIKTYTTKFRVDDIVMKFSELVQNSQYTSGPNIECKGISISKDGTLSTLCNIYGKEIGADDSNGRLGSSRIETMNFVDELSNTTKNHFVLLNPPTSLSYEKIEWNGLFTTRTTIPVQVRYVSVQDNS